MEFELSEDQRAFQEVAQNFAASELAPHAADWDWVTAELARRFGASWPAKPVITCEVETVRKYHCALENEEDWKDLKQATKASSSADHTIHMTVRDA